MSRRVLQVIVSILALNALAVGGLYLLTGLKGIALTGVKISIDPSVSSWNSVDYLFRALAGIWFTLGLMFVYPVPSIERQTALLCRDK